MSRAGEPNVPEPSQEDFAARAERERRAGDADAALRTARQGLAADPRHTAGRVAAGLALLDLGRVAEARSELEAIVRVADTVAHDDAPLSDLAEAEVDSAFEAAAPEEESMLDAEGIALQAVTAVEETEVDAGPELPGDAFRTHSMARLLEEQGDREAAEAIREALRADDAAGEAVTPRAAPDPPAEPASATPPPPDAARRPDAAPSAGRRRRGKRIAVLERWLHNVRRGQG